MKYIGLLLGIALWANQSHAQSYDPSAVCVDYFGVGLMDGEKCRPIPGEKRKIDIASIPEAIEDKVPNIQIVSEEDPGTTYDLTALSTATHIVNLDLFLVGPVDLTPLNDMTQLLRLELGADASLALDKLTTDLPNVAELWIWAPGRSVDLSALRHMPQLRKIYVDAETITGLDGIDGLHKLERATFKPTTPTDFTSLSSHNQLEWLEISGSLGRTVLSDISFVSSLTSLTHLELYGNDIIDVSPLENLGNLKLLVLSENNGLSDISPLSGLVNVTNLQLRSTQVSDLSPLENMKNLTLLWLDGAPVSDITPLAGLTNLWALELYDTDVSDIGAVRDLPLEHLDVRRTNVTDFSAVPAGTSLKK